MNYTHEEQRNMVNDLFLRRTIDITIEDYSISTNYVDNITLEDEYFSKISDLLVSGFKTGYNAIEKASTKLRDVIDDKTGAKIEVIPLSDTQGFRFYNVERIKVPTIPNLVVKLPTLLSTLEGLAYELDKEAPKKLDRVLEVLKLCYSNKDYRDSFIDRVHTFDDLKLDTIKINNELKNITSSKHTDRVPVKRLISSLTDLKNVNKDYNKVSNILNVGDLKILKRRLDKIDEYIEKILKEIESGNMEMSRETLKTLSSVVLNGANYVTQVSVVVYLIRQTGAVVDRLNQVVNHELSKK